MALYYFIKGSIQQNDSMSAAWDAYYCQQAVIPTSIMVATLTVIWIAALYIAAFNIPDKEV
jgi:hypothetical protein